MNCMGPRRSSPQLPQERPYSGHGACRSSTAMHGPAKPRLEFIALRAHNGSMCGVADMPLTGPIPEGRPFFCPHCGALYSVTDSPRPKGDNTTAKCVVCTQTMVEWASTESRVYNLIHRPEDA